jgi:hypothetical protein
MFTVPSDRISVLSVADCEQTLLTILKTARPRRSPSSKTSQKRFRKSRLDFLRIENTHRDMGKKKPLVKAILDGAQQVGRHLSTLAICFVFVPVLLLTGAAK